MLSSVSPILVAQADSMLIGSVLGAIRAADANSAKAAGGPSIRQDEYIPSRRVIHPEPRIEPREVIHLTRRTEHTGPIPDSLTVQDIRAAQNSSADSIHTDAGDRTSHGIKAPWQCPPWATQSYQCENRTSEIPARRVVKIIVHRTDKHSSGSMIDLFC